MPGEKFTNVGVTYVAGTLPPTATTLSVTPGSGAVLPILGTGEYFTLVLTSPSTGNIEVVRCTARTGDTLTIERAMEPVWGKPAVALQFEDGDEVRNSPSAEWYGRVAFESQLNAESARLDAAITQEIHDRTAAVTQEVTDRTAADALKADKTDVNAALALKSDTTYVDGELASLLAAIALLPTAVGVNADLQTLRDRINLNSTAAFSAPGYTDIYRWAFPANTRMLFQQTTPPTGWTKEVNAAYDNVALRLVTGPLASRSTGETFSDTFRGSATTEDHELTQAQIPQHTHTSGTLQTDFIGMHHHIEGGIHHSSTNFAAEPKERDYADGAFQRPTGSATTALAVYQTSDSGNHRHQVEGSTGNQAPDGALLAYSGHSHGMNLAVKYRDVVLAIKDAESVPTSTAPAPL